MTNQEKFIEIFGIDVWQQMIVFSGLADQFKEFWTSPYQKGSKERDYDAEYRNHSEMILNAQKARDKE